MRRVIERGGGSEESDRERGRGGVRRVIERGGGGE